MENKNLNITKLIAKASKIIGNSWPLYSFVTSNPLSGYEEMGFEAAVMQAEKLLDAKVYPAANCFKRALGNAEIDRDVLADELKRQGLNRSVDEYLDIIQKRNESRRLNEFEKLDREVSKWLSCFTDEGLAEWKMPYKEEGFYVAWKKLAKYDKNFGKVLERMPEDSLKMIEILLKSYNEDQAERILIHHLAALPGWTGHINFRKQQNSEWYQKYPLSLEDYLAVRLLMARQMGMDLIPKGQPIQTDEEFHIINLAFLRSWERSFQNKLISSIKKNKTVNPEKTADAQFVFCIDTRSEQIRRQVETAGNYETFGYAGFFGIAMDYLDESAEVVKKSCPPILDSAYEVSERPRPEKIADYQNRKKELQQQKFRKYFLNRMKNMLPSAFGFVEGSGLAYGAGLLGRSLFPAWLYRNKKKNEQRHEDFCDTSLQPKFSTAYAQVSVEDKAKILKTAFDLLGWQKFASLVIFAGHGSHTANNAFASSLDCGACAASPGRHNARMLAAIANDRKVRELLQKEFEISIPAETLFLAAEHNTATDEILLFDSSIPQSHTQKVDTLKRDLLKIQQNATENRLGIKQNSVRGAERKANDWSETRPEWGLARNAGFIIGPRNLSKEVNLDSRCFLHSYDWRLDNTGHALEAIMLGPMTVTQWINNHYYFATVDNDRFGGGNKIFQNITGRFGVVMGNGGDLKMGLPLQSVNESDMVNYHEPLRLTVVIQAPLARVEEILKRLKGMKSLVENEWIHLLVMDPVANNEVLKLEKGQEWSKLKTIERVPARSKLELV